MIDPIHPSDDRRVPVSPQLAFRVAIMGGVALILFAIIFFRLWYLQVLSSSQYTQLAAQNVTRELPIAAPRGSILARGGQTLAGTESTAAVQVNPSKLPTSPAARTALYRRLAWVLQIKSRDVNALIKQGEATLPYANVTIATDVSQAQRDYILERAQDFPGVTAQPIYVRDYPLNDLAAQVLGTVGVLNKFDQQQSRYRSVQAGTIVGQSGVEAAYDRYLRGIPGEQQVEVNAFGRAQPTPLPEIQPTPGDEVRLTLDLPLEEEGEKALQQGIGLAQSNGNPASRGAFVAMNPLNGEVLAMGSAPTFDPNIFTHPLTPAQVKALDGGGNDNPPAPQLNRAIQGLYPTGSTFKPITAMAGLEAGLITPETTMGGGSCVTIGNECLHNSGEVNDGSLDLENALRVSEDTYFYLLGAMENSQNPRGGVLQKMAHYLGLGELTGVDLPGEEPGNIPDPAWRAKVDREEAICKCGVADGRPWSVGDNVNLATGQGDLQATPLQMAVVYSSLADAYRNDGYGRVPVPHLGLEIDNPQGQLIQRIASPPGRHIHLNEGDLSVVMDGLHMAASAPGGTSSDVWTGWNQDAVPVYGKTGTAVRNGQSDQAWYCCYLPGTATRSPIVIVVTIEQGGFGDQSAAPVARLMASEWYGVQEKLVAGTSATL
ncbi:MAG TPA: penicillin-binding protein 2 [Solirubrobacteraceae bacterium]|jgi:penicillin-binding protein 2|nr:penicillin-binding protein 2 [Solirubrobacteraceae bacterium]